MSYKLIYFVFSFFLSFFLSFFFFLSLAVNHSKIFIKIVLRFVTEWIRERKLIDNRCNYLDDLNNHDKEVILCILLSCFWEFIIIIILLLCHQHGYPRHSLATPTYRSSLPAGLPVYTPYPHRAAVCSWELVALTLLGHAKRSIGVHHLWARPYPELKRHSGHCWVSEK